MGKPHLHNSLARWRRYGCFTFCLVASASALCSSALCESHRLQVNVSDDSGRPLPCRIHLKDDQGRAQRASGLPFWSDHFVCSGRVAIDLEVGRYVCEIERGPEYERKTMMVDVADEPSDVDVTLSRIAQLRNDGWYSGDLHVHRKLDEIALLMQAEDLDCAPVITWWNNQNAWRQTTPPTETVQKLDDERIYTVMAGEDEREGGALLFFGLKKPLDLSVKSREFPSPMRFVAEARNRNANVWIDIEKPFWWDVPVWLASGQMNSIGIANNHMCRSQMYEDEAWGRPRDASRLPAPRGNGLWTQEIYYHLLNAGLRVPPSAGSASGVLPNPVGYNRVYVHLDETLSRDAWFEGLSKGRSFVTNGPLLRVRANGHLPGATLQTNDRRQLDLKLNIRLTSSDNVPHIEVIHNGRVAKTVEWSEEIDQERPVTLTIDEPGWFLVRAITDVDHTFRFASTAPWYVESKDVDRRISRSSAQLFLDWVDERIARVQKNVTDLDQLRSVLEPHGKARAFWMKQVKAANADLGN